MATGTGSWKNKLKYLILFVVSHVRVVVEREKISIGVSEWTDDL